MQRDELIAYALGKPGARPRPSVSRELVDSSYDAAVAALPKSRRPRQPA